MTCDDVISGLEESIKNELEEGEPCSKKSRSADGEVETDFADQTPVSMEVEVVADIQIGKMEKSGESKTNYFVHLQKNSDFNSILNNYTTRCVFVVKAFIN